ncbi:MAG TPA: hypothetical protein VIQ03_11795 [Gammaproteobacteria bacterium]
MNKIENFETSEDIDVKKIRNCWNIYHITSCSSTHQQRLIDELRAWFEAFIKLIATAIDEKSAFTGGYCRRLPAA